MGLLHQSSHPFCTSSFLVVEVLLACSLDMHKSFNMEKASAKVAQDDVEVTGSRRHKGLSVLRGPPQGKGGAQVKDADDPEALQLLLRCYRTSSNFKSSRLCLAVPSYGGRAPADCWNPRRSDCCPGPVLQPRNQFLFPGSTSMNGSGRGSGPPQRSASRTVGSVGLSVEPPPLQRRLRPAALRDAQPCTGRSASVLAGSLHVASRRGMMQRRSREGVPRPKKS